MLLTLFLFIAWISLDVRLITLANAIPMWPGTCAITVTSNWRYSTSSTYSYEAFGCEYSTTFIYIMANSTPGFDPATILLDGGYVQSSSSSGIGLQAHTAADAPNRGPLRVTIRNIVFGIDSVFKFQGVFPANSSLTVSNNSFHLTFSNSNAAYTAYASAISFGEDSADFILRKASVVTIIDNRVTSAGAHATMIVCMHPFMAKFSLSEQSVFTVANNTLKGYCKSNVYLFFIRANTIYLDQQSSLAAINNQVVDFVADMHLIIISWVIEVGLLGNVTLLNASTLIVNGNNFVRARAGVTTQNVKWSFDNQNFWLFISGSSKIIMSENRATGLWLPSLATHQGILIASSNCTITVAEGSRILITNNSMSNVSIPLDAAEAYSVKLVSDYQAHIIVIGNSSLRVEGNKMCNSSGPIHGVSLVSPNITFYVTHHSAVSLSNNSISDCTKGMGTRVLYVSRITQAVFTDNCLLEIDGNALSSISSLNEMSSVFFSARSIAVSNQSTVSIEENMFANMSSKVASGTCISLDLGYVVITAGSMVSISNNIFTGSTFLGATTAVVVSAASVTVNVGELIISGNVIESVFISDTSSSSSSLVGVYIKIAANLSLRNGIFTISDSSINTVNTSNKLAVTLASVLAAEIIMDDCSSLRFSNSSFTNVAAQSITSVQLDIPTIVVGSSSDITVSEQMIILPLLAGMQTSMPRKYAWVALIIFGQLLQPSNANITLTTNSKIVVNNNTIAMYDNATTANVGVLLFVSAKIGLSESQFIISNNTALIRSSTANATIALSGGPIELFGPSAAFIIANNSIETISTSVSHCPPILLEITDVYGGFFSLIGNEVKISQHINSDASECPCIRMADVSSLSEFIVEGNTISISQFKYAEFIFLPALNIPTKSTARIAYNHFNLLNCSNYFSVLYMSYLTMDLASTFDTSYNTVATQQAPAPSFMLMEVSSVSIDRCTCLAFCGNVLFGDHFTGTRIPNQYLAMDILVSQKAVGCRTQSMSRNETMTLSLVSSQTLSRPESSSQSVKHSVSDTGTTSLSESESLSTTPSKASATLSVSDESPTASTTVSSSGSASETVTCRDHFGLDITDTCEVMRPLPTNLNVPALLGQRQTVNLDASWRTRKFDCTSIGIPYKIWSGRQDSLHTIGIVAVDSRVTFNSTLLNPMSLRNESEPLVETVTVRSEEVSIMLYFGSNEEVFNATRKGVLPGPTTNLTNVTFTYPVASATFRYTGPTTLNKIQYHMDCVAWTRCPIAMPGSMEVTLFAADRLFPVSVTDTVSTLTTLGSMLSVSPTAVARLGVSTALQKISRCASLELDDERDQSSFSAFTGGISNPSKLKIGDGGGGRKYIRGAMVTSLVYLLVFSTMILAFTTASSKIASFLKPKSAVKVLSTTVTALEHHESSLLSGYPSALVAVGSFVMDNAIAGGTILGIAGDEWADYAFGWLTVLGCVMYAAHILFVTIRLPTTMVSVSLEQRLSHAPSLTDVATAEDLDIDWVDDAVVNSKRPTKEPKTTKTSHSQLSDLRTWLVKPTDKWACCSPEQQHHVNQWMSRYESYVADMRVGWYCGFEQTVALLICFLGTLSIDNMGFCIARGVICSLLLGIQAVVMIFIRPPIHRWRWLLLSFILLLQAISASLAAANAPLQDQDVEFWMDSFGLIVSILLAIAFCADTLLLFEELLEAAKVTMRERRKEQLRKKKLPREDTDDGGETLLVDLLAPSPPPESSNNDVEPLPLEAPAPPGTPSPLNTIKSPKRNKAEETAIVQDILVRFEEYEKSLIDSQTL